MSTYEALRSALCDLAELAVDGTTYQLASARRDAALAELDGFVAFIQRAQEDQAAELRRVTEERDGLRVTTQEEQARAARLERERDEAQERAASHARKGAALVERMRRARKLVSDHARRNGSGSSFLTDALALLATEAPAEATCPTCNGAKAVERFCTDLECGAYIGDHFHCDIPCPDCPQPEAPAEPCTHGRGDLSKPCPVCPPGAPFAGPVLTDAEPPAEATQPQGEAKPEHRTCNRHRDCDEADDKADSEKRRRPDHCHIEDCEDCFGC